MTQTFMQKQQIVFPWKREVKLIKTTGKKSFFRRRRNGDVM